MISPSPTQPPQKAPAPEEQKVVVRTTSHKRRAGETPLARFIKAIFRPIIKLFYYLIRAIRMHKLLTLVVILLLIASVSATTYVTTGSFPFGIGQDPFNNFQVHGGNGGGSYVQNWLYALRDGNVAKLELLQAGLSSPQQAPDPTQAVSQYSQPHLSWTSINLIANYNQPDGTVDTFVSVEVSGNGPGGAAKGVMVWHFITAQAAQGRLLQIDLVSFRPALQ